MQPFNEENRRIELKPITSFPKSVLKDLHILQMDKYHGSFKIIGSASYRGSLYPSDYDCFETIRKNDREHLIRYFINGIKRTVRKVQKNKYHYFMEVKLGLDMRYDIDIGKCHNNIFFMNPDLKSIINNMLYHGLFSNIEKKIFIDIFNCQQYTQIEYEKLKKIIRQHYIVRWTSNEILDGFKYLPLLDKPYTLEEALQFKSPINIEIISIVNNKIVDESNFFYLLYDDGKELKILNFEDNVVKNFRSYFAENLKSSMDQLLNSKLDYNPIKVLKRIYSYCRMYGNDELLDKALLILNSPLGGMYQLKSEIGTLIKLMGTHYKIPIRIIKSSLQQIKYKISSMLFFSNKELEDINNIINQLDKIKYNKMALIGILEHIKNKIGVYVNDTTTKLMKDVGLLPFPSELLPKNRVY